MANLVGQSAAATLAFSLVQRFGSLSAILATTAEHLCDVPGMTPALARLLVHAQLVRQAAASEEIAARPLIGSRTALRAYFHARLGCLPIERVLGLFLNAKHGLIAEETFASGTGYRVSLSIRDIVRRALHHESSALILVYHYPSGDLTPSWQDKDCARALTHALAAVDVVVHDHVIVGSNSRWYSFREERIL